MKQSNSTHRYIKFIQRFILAVAMASYTKSIVANDFQGIQNKISLLNTTKAEMIKLLGNPQEIINEDGADIFIYSNHIDVPILISFIPIIGDVADIISTANRLKNNQELIIQFNEKGLVKKYKLRTLE